MIELNLRNLHRASVTMHAILSYQHVHYISVFSCFCPFGLNLVGKPDASHSWHSVATLPYLAD